MADLFAGFLNYYSVFDFQHYAISVNSSLRMLKENRRAMTIDNPFDLDFNSAQNVNESAVNHFIQNCITSREIIESVRTGSGFDLFGFFSIVEKSASKTKPKK